MKKNILIAVVMFNILPCLIFCQVNQLIQNGGFENGSPHPTVTEQINALNSYGTIQNADSWLSPGSSTADWYAASTKNYSDVLQGG